MQTIEETSELLYKALWESKTKEEDVMDIVLKNNSDRREAIKKYYSAVHPERGGLLEDIKKKLGSNYKDAIYALFLSPVEYDCYQIRRAVKGFSIDEECVYEIITNRPFWMLQDIKKKYLEMYEKELEKEIEKNFSGVIGKNLVILLNTERSENKTPIIRNAKMMLRLYTPLQRRKHGAPMKLFLLIFLRSHPHGN